MKEGLIVFNVLFFQGTLAAIDAQAAEQKAAVAKFTAESNARIEGIKVLPYTSLLNNYLMTKLDDFLKG